VNPRNLPNLITALRLLLVVPVVWLMLRQRFGAALVVFAVAGFSDALDGYLARRFGWFTRLGGWLDPIADKTMMVSCYVVLAWAGLVPLWLLLTIIARDALILVGGTLYYFWVEKVDAAPSWISKANTVAQILLVMALMFDRGVAPLPAFGVDALIALVTVTTVSSGVDYVVTWGLRAMRVKRGQA
jgi:cardiolipin synthase